MENSARRIYLDDELSKTEAAFVCRVGVGSVACFKCVPVLSDGRVACHRLVPRGAAPVHNASALSRSDERIPGKCIIIMESHLNNLHINFMIYMPNCVKQITVVPARKYYCFHVLTLFTLVLRKWH